MRLTVGLLLALALAACGSSRDRDLADGVAAVKAILERAGKNYADSVALQSALETGGTVVSYVSVNLAPGDSPLRRLKLAMNRPTTPWTIVIKEGDGARDYVIEGYGEDLQRPLHVERVLIAPVPAP